MQAVIASVHEWRRSSFSISRLLSPCRSKNSINTAFTPVLETDESSRAAASLAASQIYMNHIAGTANATSLLPHIGAAMQHIVNLAHVAKTLSVFHHSDDMRAVASNMPEAAPAELLEDYAHGLEQSSAATAEQDGLELATLQIVTTAQAPLHAQPADQLSQTADAVPAAVQGAMPHAAADSTADSASVQHITDESANLQHSKHPSLVALLWLLIALPAVALVSFFAWALLGRGNVKPVVGQIDSTAPAAASAQARADGQVRRCAASEPKKQRGARELAALGE